MSRIQETRFVQMRHLVRLVALSLAIAPLAAGADATVEELTNPDTTQFSFGLAYTDEDNQRYGMYNGLEDAHGYGIGSLNIIRRDDETGTWARLSGRNLGLDTAELAAEYERQGAWRIAIDYGQTTRATPYEFNTRLTGIGSNNLAVNGAPAFRDIDLETNRYKTRLELSRYFGPEFEFKMLFQNEKKHGERLFGRGNGANQEFLAEPIEYQTRQLDLALNYTGDRLQLSGGYYGSFFNNDNTELVVTGGAAGISPIALPPDNSAHEFNLMGGYQFTKTTRGNFKLAYTRAIQDDDFLDPAPLANISGRTDLGGRVDTTLVDLGLTSRPLPKLNLVAKLRYEDRNDRTEVARYITPNASTDGFNEPRSLTTENAKLEATYLLPQGFSLTGGLDAERKDRTMDGVRVVGYRSRVEEVTGRLRLSRSIADTLNGSLGYEHSNRTGTDFRTLRVWNTNGTANNFTDDFFGNPYVLGGLVQPVFMADRERNKGRLALDWLPTDALSFQFNAEKTWDDYEAGRQSPAEIGVRDGDSWLVNVDATYVVNDNWKLSAWATRSVTNLDQATCRNVTSAVNCDANSWTAGLTSRSDAVGAGVRGKIRNKLNVGADVIYMRDHNEYDLAGVGNSATAADLPDITSHLATLKLFANYPVGKESSVQLDYTLDHRKTDDWTWTDWAYRDGTTVDQDPNETVHFLGVSFRYGFR